MSEKSMKFEASMERLEAIVRQLEQGNAPLDESLKLFQEGTKLVQSCAKQLDSAEQEIVKLTKTAAGTALPSKRFCRRSSAKSFPRSACSTPCVTVCLRAENASVRS